jgi:hypothetical protein
MQRCPLRTSGGLQLPQKCDKRPVILADLGACRSRVNNFRDEDNPGNLSVPSTGPVWVRMQAARWDGSRRPRSLDAPRLALRQDLTELSSF